MHNPTKPTDRTTLLHAIVARLAQQRGFSLRVTASNPTPRGTFPLRVPEEEFDDARRDVMERFHDQRVELAYGKPATATDAAPWLTA